MKELRKRAKKYLKSIRTINEFNEFLDTLVLTDLEKDIAKDIYIHGFSHTQIASKYNVSIETSKILLSHVLDKVF